MIVSAGYFRSIRAPSFQSSHETALSRRRLEAGGSSPVVIGAHSAGILRLLSAIFQTPSVQDER
jgi:hypothetical protein